MRRKVKNRKAVQPDFLYESELVGKFINHIMKDGKKNAAIKIMHSVLDDIKKKTKTENPIEILEKAIENAAPLLEVKSKRVGGANYQVPVEVRPDRRHTLAMRWILDGARSKKGADMVTRLSGELIDASKNEGSAVKKKENTHKMAEANRAFAHFSW